MAHCSKLIHHLKIYATEDVLEETDPEIMQLSQLPKMASLKVFRPQWLNTSRCPYRYDEYKMKETLIEDLSRSIRHTK